jgi:aminomethyltransferase
MRGRGPQRRVYPWVGPNRPPQSAEEIPRLGDPVLDAEGGEIGTVTSGTFSPKHEALIGLAAVAADRAVDGAEIRIAARTGEIAARLERR